MISKKASNIANDAIFSEITRRINKRNKDANDDGATEMNRKRWNGVTRKENRYIF